MGAAIPLISLAVTVGSTGASVIQQNKARRREESAQKIAQRQAQIENQRAIRQAIAASRADQARTLNAASGTTGGFSSSGIQGGIGAAQTQLASNVGFARTTEAANKSANDRLQGANRAASQAATFGQIAGLPAKFGFSTSETFQEFFKKGPSNGGSATA